LRGAAPPGIILRGLAAIVSASPDNVETQTALGLNRHCVTDQTDTRTQLPPPVRELFDPAWQQVALVHAKWHVTKQLYATSEARSAVLNRTAHDFFALCQHAFVSDILMSSGRLLDPAQTGKKQNLSLERLRDSVAACGVQTLTDEVTRLLAEARQLEASAREHRNRRLAHNDLATILASGSNPLPPVTVADIDGLLDSLGRFLNTIDGHFCENTTFFADPIQNGDGDSLARWLRDGVTYREQLLNLKRAQAGLPEVPSSLLPEA
jgi:hypothetical protein